MSAVDHHAPAALLTLRQCRDIMELSQLEAARDGRLPVVYDTRTTFRHLRARATPAAAQAFLRTYFKRRVRPKDRRAPLRLG